MSNTKMQKMIQIKYFTDNHTFLKIESNQLESYINFINDTNVENIAVNEAWGYYLKDLEFVDRCKNIKRIIIVDNDIDISALSGLRKLTFIQSASNPKQPIDLMEIGNIEELRIIDNKKWLHLYSLPELRTLSLYSFKDVTFPSDTQWSGLKKITLTQGKLETTSGICDSHNLEELNLNLLAKLASIEFDRPLPMLKKIKIEGCKNIEYISGFENLPAIEEIMFLNCRELKSIAFLEHVSKTLQKVTIKGSKVLDNELGPLMAVSNYFYDGIKPLIKST